MWVWDWFTNTHSKWTNYYLLVFANIDFKPILATVGYDSLWFWQFRFIWYGTEYINLQGKRRRIFYFLRRIYFLMSIIIAFVVFISLDYPMESLMFPDIFYPITLGFTKRSRPLFYFPLFFARGTCIFNFERRGGLNMHCFIPS